MADEIITEVTPLIEKTVSTTNPMNWDVTDNTLYPAGKTEADFARVVFLTKIRVDTSEVTAMEPIGAATEIAEIPVIRDGHYQLDMALVPNWGLIVTALEEFGQEISAGAVFYNNGKLWKASTDISIANIAQLEEEPLSPWEGDYWEEYTPTTPADITNNGLVLSGSVLQKVYRSNTINDIQFLNLFRAFAKKTLSHAKDFDFSLETDKEEARRLMDKYLTVDLAADLGDWSTAQYEIESVEGDIY